MKGLQIEAMPLISRTLLCIAVLLTYGVEQTSAAPPWGRFDRRILASNQTTSIAVIFSDPSSDDIQAGSLSLLATVASEASSSTISDVVTSPIPAASISAGTAASLSSAQQLYTLQGLETITTVPRPNKPTTAIPGSVATTSFISIQPSSDVPNESSGYSSGSDSVPSESESTTTFRGSYGNTSTSVAVSSSIISSNSSVVDLGWNSTVTIDTNLTTITTDPPPPRITTYDPQTLSVIIPDEPTTDACDVTTNSNTVTVWSTIYTTTITWTLPPELYTPPYPTTSSTPVYCSQTTARLSVSPCDGSDCTQYTYPADATATSDDGHRHVNPTATSAGTTIYASGSAGKSAMPTITFWTTDKNPAVVYSSETPPDYGDPGTTAVQDHNTPDNNNYPTSIPKYEKPTSSSSVGGSNGGGDTAGNGGSGGGKTTGNNGNESGSGSTAGGGTGIGNSGGNTNGAGNNGGGGSGASPTSSEAARQTPTAATAVTVIIQTTQVIINDHTFIDNPRSATSTVVIGTDTFVINPTQVVGAGATVVRPVSGGIFIPTKTTTTIGGVEVVYTEVGNYAISGQSVIASATIDGTIFTIGTTPSTAIIKGQTIILGPGGIAFASQTIPIVTAAGATESAVLGGEMITAIGNSIAVIDGTTFSYGLGMSTITKVINGDTVLIGPSGVSVHGITLGGITAAPTATTYEIVGGATITQIGGSAIIIDGMTYSIGAAATSAITTVIDGQTLTIGPSGVAASSYTFAQPYATSTVIEPGSTTSVVAATNTAESTGSTLRSLWDTTIMKTCIAIGVGLLGGLLL